MSRATIKMAAVLLAVMLLAGCTASFKTGQMNLAFDVGEKVGEQQHGEILHHDASVPGLTVNWSGDPAAAVKWLLDKGKALFGGAIVP